MTDMKIDEITNEIIKLITGKVKPATLQKFEKEIQAELLAIFRDGVFDFASFIEDLEDEE